MAKLKKGRQNGNHAKAPSVQKPPSPTPAPAPAVVNALVSAAPAASTATVVASSAPGTSSEGTSKPSSFTSLGKTSRPPLGVGASNRSIRSVSSASIDTSSYTPSSPSSSPPTTTASSSAASVSATALPPASPSSNSALSSLRTKLDTDEARRTRLASVESAASEEPPAPTSVSGKKLQKKRPSAGPDVFADPSPSPPTPTETTEAETSHKRHESDNSVVAYEDDTSSGSASQSQSPPSGSGSSTSESTPPKVRHVHYLDDDEDEPAQQPTSQSWLGWSFGLGTQVARKLPIVSRFVPEQSPYAEHQAEEEEYSLERPPKVHGLVWQATEVALGLSLAGVLVAVVATEIVVEKVWTRGSKGKAIEA